MRAKMYEKYYKLGFDHMMFKNVMGLKRPKKKIKLFYLVLIVILLSIGLILF